MSAQPRLPKHPLTPKRQRFVREYLIDHNGTRAAIRAGYSPRTANEQAAKDLLANPSVRAEIEKAERKINDKLEITAERIKAEIAKLAFANMEDYVVHENGDITPDLSKCNRNQMAAIQEFTVDATGGTGDGERKLIMRTRLKLSPKREALELLGRCRDIQLFSDHVELGGDDALLAALAAGRKRLSECRRQK